MSATPAPVTAVPSSHTVRSFLTLTLLSQFFKLTWKPLGWNNLTIHLSAADENFGDTLSLYSGSSSNGLTTSDKGKTWHTDAIKISKDTFATVSDY